MYLHGFVFIILYKTIFKTNLLCLDKVRDSYKSHREMVLTLFCFKLRFVLVTGTKKVRVTLSSQDPLEGPLKLGHHQVQQFLLKCDRIVKVAIIKSSRSRRISLRGIKTQNTILNKNSENLKFFLTSFHRGTRHFTYD